MAYRERLVKCGDCGDIFKIIYDSKKAQQDHYKCKCGKLNCFPDNFGSYSYERNGNPEKLSYDDQKSSVIYYPEDYITITTEEQNLLNEIDEIGTKLSHDKWYSPYSNRSDEDNINLELSRCSKSNEGISIKLEVRLKSYGSRWSNKEIEKTHQRLSEGLMRFKLLINKIYNSEINIDDVRKIWNDNSLEWYDGNKRQQELYDYELYC